MSKLQRLFGAIGFLGLSLAAASATLPGEVMAAGAVASGVSGGIAVSPSEGAKTVVFIHGMFMTPTCWDEWKSYFEARGYTVMAPAWPLHDQSVEAQQKAHPNLALGKLSLDEVVKSYADLLGPLKEKPILIGHSMGGLVVQRLMQQHLGSVGVAIDSAPAQGVFTLKWSFLKSNLPVISPFANQSIPFKMDLKGFRYTFANTLNDAESQAAYDRYVVPESRLVAHGPTSKAGHIDFAAPHEPLLFIAGGADHIIPESLNRSNAKKYKPEAGIVAFKAFEGRSHYTLAQSGWQEVASYVADWVKHPQAGGW